MQVIIRGAHEVIASLDAPRVSGAVDVTLQRWSRRLVQDLARYPSPPSGSTYRRTGTLGRAWNTESTYLRHVIGNNVRYATYVQGPEQAWMHRGRWLTAEEAVTGHLPEIAQDIAEDVARVLGG